MNIQTRNKKTCYLFCFLLLLLLFVFDPNKGVAHTLKTILFTTLFLLSCGWLTRYKAGIVPAAILLTAVSGMIGLRIFMHLEYNSDINHSLAETFLATSPREAISMTLMYWPYLPVWVGISVLFYLFCRTIGLSFPPGVLRRVVGIFVFYLLVTSAVYYFSGKSRSDDFVWGERLTAHTPFYTLGEFFRAYHNQNQINAIKTYQPTFDYLVVNSEIDNYVLVIGESARRSDLSLYGRKENTTPHAVAQQKNMLVFDRAVSPAPMTILSVPASIANVPLGYTGAYTAYADNILTLAESMGLQTYWFSNQGVGGLGYGLVAAISFRAKRSRWNPRIIADESLLADLEAALKQPERKLIVLHIYGSHPPACGQVADDNVIAFTEDHKENCYLSSIYYTDKFLNEIMQRLANNRSTMLYFSDHGLIRTANGEYHHGVAEPVKTSFDIPMYIWYSEKLAGDYPRGKRIADLYSGSADYWVISDWLGIRQRSEKRCVSPLADCYQPAQNIQVMDGNKFLLQYDKLAVE